MLNSLVCGGRLPKNGLFILLLLQATMSLNDLVLKLIEVDQLLVIFQLLSLEYVIRILVHVFDERRLLLLHLFFHIHLLLADVQMDQGCFLRFGE